MFFSVENVAYTLGFFLQAVKPEKSLDFLVVHLIEAQTCSIEALTCSKRPICCKAQLRWMLIYVLDIVPVDLTINIQSDITNGFFIYRSGFFYGLYNLDEFDKFEDGNSFFTSKIAINSYRNVRSCKLSFADAKVRIIALPILHV